MNLFPPTPKNFSSLYQPEKVEQFNDEFLAWIQRTKKCCNWRPFRAIIPPGELVRLNPTLLK